MLPNSHKRTKSSLALSLLHRSKVEAQTEPLGAATSPSASPTTSQHGFSPLRPQKPKQDAYKSTTHTDLSDKAQNNLHSKGFASRSTKRSADGQNLGLTIEQSVRTFRLFEVLRNGDHAAIAKAVPEACGGHSLEGSTILHLAVQCAEPSVVEQILSMLAEPGISIDVNAQDRDGNTPIHLGSSLGRPTVVQVLLAQSAIDSSILNYQGRSPLDLARSPEIFQQLQLARAVFAESQVQSIHKLVGRQDLGALENMLDDSRAAAVLDINGSELATDSATIETGGTLLHEAARNKNIQMIQLLLLHGADPFRRDRKGKLPQDVTKDDRTRAILRKSPAAAAAQRGIQEKAILGGSTTDNALGAKESREIKGYLKKWTNYTSGYKLRWFVLEDGVLSYYKHQGKSTRSRV